MLRSLIRALSIFAAIYLAIYFLTSTFVRHAGEPQDQVGPTVQQVKAQCDEWMADASPGRDRRMTREVCAQMEARARERR